MANISSPRLYLSCLVLAVWLALPLRGLAHAAPHDADGTQLYAFGLHLFRLGDYYRAVTELKRFTLLFPHHQQHTAAQVLLGLALEGDALYDDAFIHFRRLSRMHQQDAVGQLANFKLGELHFRQRRYREAIEQLQHFLHTFPDAPLAPRSTYLIGLSRALEGHFEQARRVLHTVPADPLLGSRTQRLQQALKTPPTPRQSPRTARLLAGLLPGAGHLYLGKPWQGLTAFLLNGSFLTGAVFAFREHLYATGAILLYFETGWYLGNINSAGAAAEDANRRRQRTFADALKRTYAPPPLTLPDLQSPALGLRLTF